MKIKRLLFLLIFIGGLNEEGLARELKYFSAVQQVLTEVRPQPSMKEVEVFLKNAPKVKSSDTLEKQAQQISSYLFKDLKITADQSFQSRNNKDNILPDSVLKTKQGHCLGLTILFLLVAEKNDLQVSFVRGPDHAFPRLCKKDKCINSEMLKEGELKSDSYYVENLLIPKAALDKKLYLTKIDSGKELKSSIYLGLGFVANQARQKDLAELFYLKSIENSENFAEPHSDLAAILAGSGQIDEARSELGKALAINPTHYASLLNLGILEEKTGNVDKAIDDYDQAIAANPLTSLAYLKRSNIYKSRHDSKKALTDLDRILLIEPKYCDVIKDRLALGKNEDLSTRLNSLEKTGDCLSLEAIPLN